MSGVVNVQCGQCLCGECRTIIGLDWITELRAPYGCNENVVNVAAKAFRFVLVVGDWCRISLISHHLMFCPSLYLYMLNISSFDVPAYLLKFAHLILAPTGALYVFVCYLLAPTGALYVMVYYYT